MDVVEAVHEARARDILADDTSDIWIFGFGSLIHNPGFEYADKKTGYIRGWRRVWYQGSTDHRGTPENPGRTVTLEADATAWGAVFKLAGTPEEQHKTLAWLEWREKQYDLRQRVDVYSPLFSSSEPVVRGALCYIATSCSMANPNYLGRAALDVIAAQIAVSKGPSGDNFEYLFKLADALRAIPGAVDEELFVLERHVRDIVKIPVAEQKGEAVLIEETNNKGEMKNKKEEEDAGGAGENEAMTTVTL